MKNEESLSVKSVKSAVKFLRLRLCRAVILPAAALTVHNQRFQQAGLVNAVFSFARHEFQTRKCSRGMPDCRMMDCNVPILTVRCSGTGTVIVPPSDAFCMIMWLPFCRARMKPSPSIIRTISAPENTPSLGTLHLDAGEQGWLLEPHPHLLRARRFKEPFQRLF